MTAQSADDANLNGDSAPDRAIVNPAGNANIGSGVTALTNSAGDTVAYLANNPNARYITAGLGTLATSGRNTLQLAPINNFDVTAMKRISINERFRVEFSVRAFNVLNHAQYTGGYLDDVAPAPSSGQGTALGDLTERPGTQFEHIPDVPASVFEQSTAGAVGDEVDFLGDRKREAGAILTQAHDADRP